MKRKLEWRHLPADDLWLEGWYCSIDGTDYGGVTLFEGNCSAMVLKDPPKGYRFDHLAWVSLMDESWDVGDLGLAKAWVEVKLAPLLELEVEPSKDLRKAYLMI